MGQSDDDVDDLVAGFFFELDSFDDDVEELDSFDDDEPDSFDDEDELSEPLEDFDESDDEPGGVVACEPRLSVLKNPEPLNVTPTGWKTFLTGRTLPDSG